MTSVRARLFPALLWASFVLLALHICLGLSPLGWVLGAAFVTLALGLLGHALARSGARGPRPADQVTLVRTGLVAGVTALVADSLTRPVNVAVLVGMAAVALALDALDGRVARHTRSESELGARFDMEVDAFLILVLSAYVARSLGAWVLLIGLARYLLLAAGSLWPWLRWPTPPRTWAKFVAAVQGIVLTVVAADVVPRWLAVAVTTAALALLAESFWHQVRWLAGVRPRWVALVRAAAIHVSGRRSHVQVLVTRGVTIVAVAALWLALAMPNRLNRLTPGSFVQLPAEGLALLAAALLLAPRARRRVAIAFGATLGILVLLKALDMGYYAQLDRPFDPIVEWGSLGPAFGVLRDSVGSARAYLAALGVVLLAIAVVALLVWASLRVAKRSADHRRGSVRLLAALTVGWLVSATIGVGVLPSTPVAESSTTSFALGELRNVAAAARDWRGFADQLAAPDPYRTTPAADLLTGLAGKDVIFAFVESYGQTAVQGSSFAGVTSVLSGDTKALGAAGFSARSAFLTSPTFGGVSWLAHATFQSGLWIDNQQRHDRLMGSDRFTLSDAFQKAGWRTVADVPANKGPWPEGASFYGYDHLYNATNTGYQGPRFSYATVPDQYTLDAFRRLELTPGHAPVMAEIDLVSSHYPWSPLPRLLDWSEIGDGSVYNPMPAQGPSVAALLKNDDDLKTAYGRSIQYSLQSLISFVQTAGDDNLVLVLLGDHQPGHQVSGPDANHDVPISVVAHDPAVLDRISSWGWTPGLRPASNAPVWPMDAFRTRFLDAFAAATPR